MNDDRYLGNSSPQFDWGNVNWLGLFFLILGIAWLGQSQHWWTLDLNLIGPVALVFTSSMLLLPRKR